MSRATVVRERERRRRTQEENSEPGGGRLRQRGLSQRWERLDCVSLKKNWWLRWRRQWICIR